MFIFTHPILIFEVFCPTSVQGTAVLRIDVPLDILNPYPLPAHFLQVGGLLYLTGPWSICLPRT